jgi:hypothetical protein
VGRDRAIRYVRVLEDGVPVRREVEVGWTHGGWTEITRGLSEGEEIVLPEG